MDQINLLAKMAEIIAKSDDEVMAAMDIWNMLGLEVAVKRPIVFGYEEHQQWLPGRKRLVSEWVEDEVVCKHCGERIGKVGHLPWANRNGEGMCHDLANEHSPKRS